MKILWLSCTSGNSVNRSKEKNFGGGWLISLEQQIKKVPGIELHLAFISPNESEDFLFEGTHYHPINIGVNNSSKLNKIKNWFVNQGTLYKRVKGKSLEVIEKVNPDIIHIHGTESYWGCVIPYVKDIPIVISIQGFLSSYNVKYFSGITKSQASKYQPLIGKLFPIGVNSRWKQFARKAEKEKEFVKNTNYFFGRTSWDYYCTLSLNSSRKYYVVNEILRDPFYKSRWKGNIGHGKLKIVTTISDGIYKGFETVLRSAKLLEHNDFDFEWHIAGLTPSNKWVKMSESATNIKSSSNIVFHGRIDEHKLAELLCSSDLYVQVSHIENSPNSLCEAMLVGMPIIASYAGGTNSMLTDGEEGTLYQDGDPYVLTGKIMAAVSEEETFLRYAENAQRRAAKRHDKQGISEELISGYKNIIEDFKNRKK